MIAGLIRLVTGAHARWLGVDPVRADGSLPQRIYFSNHTSNLDAPVIWASLPPSMRRMTRPVAARDYWESNSVRRFFSKRIFRCVLIERKKVTVRTNPLTPMSAALSDGSSLIIFPEGTRAVDDDAETGDFKPGLWHLAKDHPGVELVPVHLENLNRILPKGEFILIPLQAAVTFGSPVRIEDNEDKQAFLTRARAAVAALAEGGSA